MRNEQEFKALVMQKVREQQHQKQQRLQRIRATTATLSAICLVVIGVVAVVWFVKLNPSVSYGSQDGPYSGNAPQNFWDRLFSHGSEKEADWDNSASMESADDLNEGNAATSNEENANSGESNTDSDLSESPQHSVGILAGESASNGNGSATDSDNADSKENSGTICGTASGSVPQSNDATGDPPNGSTSTESSEQTETVAAFLYLEEINEEMADDLALSGGKLEGNDDAVTSIVTELEAILKSTSATEKTGDTVLFALRFENGYTGCTYRFCEGNILVITDGEKSESYTVKPSAYLRLLRLLQSTQFTPLN